VVLNYLVPDALGAGSSGGQGARISNVVYLRVRRREKQREEVPYTGVGGAIEETLASGALVCNRC